MVFVSPISTVNRSLTNMTINCFLFHARDKFIQAFLITLLVATDVEMHRSAAVENLEEVPSIHSLNYTPPSIPLKDEVHQLKSSSKSPGTTQIQQLMEIAINDARVNASQHLSDGNNSHSPNPAESLSPFVLKNPGHDAAAAAEADTDDENSVDSDHSLKKPQKSSSTDNGLRNFHLPSDVVEFATVDKQRDDESNDVTDDSVGLQRQQNVELSFRMKGQEKKMLINVSRSSEEEEKEIDAESFYPDDDDYDDDDDDDDDDYDASVDNGTTTMNETTTRDEVKQKSGPPEGREIAYDTYDDDDDDQPSIVVNEQLYELDGDDDSHEVVRQVSIRNPDRRQRRKSKTTTATRRRKRMRKTPKERLTSESKHRDHGTRKERRTVARRLRMPRLTLAKGQRSSKRRSTPRLRHPTSYHRLEERRTQPLLFLETIPLNNRFGFTQLQVIADPNNYDNSQEIRRIWPDDQSFRLPPHEQEMSTYDETLLHRTLDTAPDPYRSMHSSADQLVSQFDRYSGVNPTQMMDPSLGLESISPLPASHVIYRTEDQQAPGGNYDNQAAAEAVADVLPLQFYDGLRPVSFKSKPYAPVDGNAQNAWHLAAEAAELQMTQRKIDDELNIRRHGNHHQLTRSQRTNSAQGQEALTDKKGFSRSHLSGSDSQSSSSSSAEFKTAVDEGTSSVAAAMGQTQQKEAEKEEEYYRPQWVMTLHRDMKPEYVWYSNDDEGIRFVHRPSFEKANHDFTYKERDSYPAASSDDQFSAESFLPMEEREQSDRPTPRPSRRPHHRPVRVDERRIEDRGLPDTGDERPTVRSSSRNN